jgi:hypothetical protein
MSYKYLGEAVALLGIAYSLFRWVARNVEESDARPGRIEIDLGRVFGRGAAGLGSRPGSHPTRAIEGEAGARAPVPTPTPPPDPEMLSAAAAMFGITRAALIAMEPRERALLLSGYRTARDAGRGGRAARGDASR